MRMANGFSAAMEGCVEVSEGSADGPAIPAMGRPRILKDAILGSMG